MRLLVIGKLPPPVHGCNMMAEICQSCLKSLGHEVTVVEKSFSSEHDDIGVLSIRKFLKVPAIGSRILLAALPRRTDLAIYFLSVDLHTLLVDTLYLAMLSLLGVPTVLYLHGKGPALLLSTSGRSCVIDVYGKGLRICGWPLWWPIRTVLARSLGALVLGERLKLYPAMFLPERRLFVLPNAIPDLPAALPAEPETGSGRAVRVIFLSNYIPSKGALEFVKMADLVAQQCDNVEFAMAGAVRSREYFSRVLEYLDSHRTLKEKVSLSGPVYGDEKQRMFRDADILVFPTTHEAFGLVVLEAMQWGLATVCSNEGCIPEIVEDGVTGYLVAPKDVAGLAERVVALARDEDLRKEMGKKSRRVYEERFTIDAYQKRLQEGVLFFEALRKEGAADYICSER